MVGEGELEDGKNPSFPDAYSSGLDLTRAGYSLRHRIDALRLRYTLDDSAPPLTNVWEGGAGMMEHIQQYFPMAPVMRVPDNFRNRPEVYRQEPAPRFTGTDHEPLPPFTSTSERSTPYLSSIPLTFDLPRSQGQGVDHVKSRHDRNATIARGGCDACSSSTSLTWPSHQGHGIPGYNTLGPCAIAQPVTSNHATRCETTYPNLTRQIYSSPTPTDDDVVIISDDDDDGNDQRKRKEAPVSALLSVRAGDSRAVEQGDSSTLTHNIGQGTGLDQSSTVIALSNTQPNQGIGKVLPLSDTGVSNPQPNKEIEKALPLSDTGVSNPQPNQGIDKALSLCNTGVSNPQPNQEIYKAMPLSDTGVSNPQPNQGIDKALSLCNTGVPNPQPNQEIYKAMPLSDTGVSNPQPNQGIDKEMPLSDTGVSNPQVNQGIEEAPSTARNESTRERRCKSRKRKLRHEAVKTERVTRSRRSILLLPPTGEPSKSIPPRVGLVAQSPALPADGSSTSLVSAEPALASTVTMALKANDGTESQRKANVLQASTPGGQRSSQNTTLTRSAMTKASNPKRSSQPQEMAASSTAPLETNVSRFGELVSHWNKWYESIKCHGPRKAGLICQKTMSKRSVGSQTSSMGSLGTSGTETGDHTNGRGRKRKWSEIATAEETESCFSKKIQRLSQCSISTQCVVSFTPEGLASASPFEMSTFTLVSNSPEVTGRVSNLETSLCSTSHDSRRKQETLTESLPRCSGLGCNLQSGILNHDRLVYQSTTLPQAGNTLDQYRDNPISNSSACPIFQQARMTQPLITGQTEYEWTRPQCAVFPGNMERVIYQARWHTPYLSTAPEHYGSVCGRQEPVVQCGTVCRNQEPVAQCEKLVDSAQRAAQSPHSRAMSPSRKSLKGERLSLHLKIPSQSIHRTEEKLTRHQEGPKLEPSEHPWQGPQLKASASNEQMFKDSFNNASQLGATRLSPSNIGFTWRESQTPANDEATCEDRTDTTDDSGFVTTGQRVQAVIQDGQDTDTISLAEALDTLCCGNADGELALNTDCGELRDDAIIRFSSTAVGAEDNVVDPSRGGKKKAVDPSSNDVAATGTGSEPSAVKQTNIDREHHHIGHSDPGHHHTGHSDPGHQNADHNKTGHRDTGCSDHGYQDTTHIDRGHEETHQSDDGRQDTDQSDGGHQDTGQSEGRHQDTGQSDGGHQDTGQSEGEHQDTDQSKPGYRDTDHSDRGHQDTDHSNLMLCGASGMKGKEGVPCAEPETEGIAHNNPCDISSDAPPIQPLLSPSSRAGNSKSTPGPNHRRLVLLEQVREHGADPASLYMARVEHWAVVAADSHVMVAQVRDGLTSTHQGRREIPDQVVDTWRKVGFLVECLHADMEVERLSLRPLTANKNVHFPEDVAERLGSCIAAHIAKQFAEIKSTLQEAVLVLQGVHHHNRHAIREYNDLIRAEDLKIKVPILVLLSQKKRFELYQKRRPIVPRMTPGISAGLYGPESSVYDRLTTWLAFLEQSRHTGEDSNIGSYFSRCLQVIASSENVQLDGPSGNDSDRNSEFTTRGDGCVPLSCNSPPPGEFVRGKEQAIVTLGSSIPLVAHHTHRHVTSVFQLYHAQLLLWEEREKDIGRLFRHTERDLSGLGSRLDKDFQEEEEEECMARFPERACRVLAEISFSLEELNANMELERVYLRPDVEPGLWLFPDDLQARMGARQCQYMRDRYFNVYVELRKMAKDFSRFVSYHNQCFRYYNRRPRVELKVSIPHMISLSAPGQADRILKVVTGESSTPVLTLGLQSVFLGRDQRLFYLPPLPRKQFPPPARMPPAYALETCTNLDVSLCRIATYYDETTLDRWNKYGTQLLAHFQGVCRDWEARIHEIEARLENVKAALRGSRDRLTSRAARACGSLVEVASLVHGLAADYVCGLLSQRGERYDLKWHFSNNVAKRVGRDGVRECSKRFETIYSSLNSAVATFHSLCTRYGSTILLYNHKTSPEFRVRLPMSLSQTASKISDLHRKGHIREFVLENFRENGKKVPDTRGLISPHLSIELQPKNSYGITTFSQKHNNVTSGVQSPPQSPSHVTHGIQSPPQHPKHVIHSVQSPPRPQSHGTSPSSPRQEIVRECSPLPCLVIKEEICHESSEPQDEDDLEPAFGKSRCAEPGSQQPQTFLLPGAEVYQQEKTTDIATPTVTDGDAHETEDPGGAQKEGIVDVASTHNAGEVEEEDWNTDCQCGCRGSPLTNLLEQPVSDFAAPEAVRSWLHVFCLQRDVASLQAALSRAERNCAEHGDNTRATACQFLVNLCSTLPILRARLHKQKQEVRTPCLEHTTSDAGSFKGQPGIRGGDQDSMEVNVKRLELSLADLYTRMDSVFSDRSELIAQHFPHAADFRSRRGGFDDEPTRS